jgi:hypothetical protein
LSTYFYKSRLPGQLGDSIMPYVQIENALNQPIDIEISAFANQTSP